MKRFVGFFLTGVGGAATVWGGFHLLLGESATQIRVGDGFAVTALHGGLVGVLLFTVGILWARD